MECKVRDKVAGGVFRAFFTLFRAPLCCLLLANLGALPADS